MNINEILFTPKFCLDIFKVIYKKKDYLFLGRLTKEELLIVNKIKDKKLLSKEEKDILNLRYGSNGVEILKYKINNDTIFIEESICLNDNIKTIKEKIYHKLSLNYGNGILETQKQYLYTRKIFDYDAITSIIPNLFPGNRKRLPKKDILENLVKIMEVKDLKLDQSEYTLEELQNYFIKLVNFKSYLFYDIGISQYYVNQSNGKIICDYIDLTKNKDEDNDYNERPIDNNYKIFNNIINQNKYDSLFDVVMNQDIFLHYHDDIKHTLKNYDYIINRYFRFIKRTSNSISNIEELEKLYQQHSVIYRKILDNKDFSGKYLNNINFVKLNKKNIIKLNIDLVGLYHLLETNEKLPFINIKHYKIQKQRLKRTILFKLHKQTFNSRSNINAKTLDNWKNGIYDMETNEYDNSEEELFREGNYLNLIFKYENNYLTFYLNETGQILCIFPILKNRKQKLSEHFFKYISRINDIIFMINNLLNNIEEGNTPESRKYDIKKRIIKIDDGNIKNLKINFIKTIPLSNLPNLNTIFEELNLFFYKVKKNRYGFKNIDNYGTDEYIINYIIDKYFDSNNTIKLEQISPEIVKNFNISTSEATKLFNKIFSSDMRDEKMIKDKRKNEINKIEVYFDNIMGKQKTLINFTCQNINQLVFINELLNLSISELNNFENRKKSIKPEIEKKPQSILDRIRSFSNSNSFINNDNSNNFSLINNSINNNSIEENSKNNQVQTKKKENKDDFKPERIDDLDYLNMPVGNYFKKMRNKYDKDFFKNSNFTRGCPAVEDRTPTIVSLKLWNYITENKKLSDALDKNNKNDNIDSDKYRVIIGSDGNKNVYICPRIFCVRCMVPVKVKDFIENDNRCPYCNGKPTKIKGVKGVFDEEHTIKIRSHSYWKNNKWEKIEVQCVDCQEKMKYFDFYNHDYKCIFCDSENVNVNEDELLPFLLELKDNNIKIPQILEESTSPMYPRKKQGSLFPCCDKSSEEKKNKETKEDYFKDSSTKLSHDEIGLLTNDLNDLFNNRNSDSIKNGDFVKTRTNKNKKYYKYRFYEKIKILAFDKKKDLVNRKMLFRLGTNNVNENNSFLVALHKLKCISEHELDNSKKDRTPFNIKQILDTINPLEFAAADNGNLHELFSTKVQEIDYDSDEYNDFFNKIKKVKLDKDSVEVKNLYNSFMNFRKYTEDKKIFKNSLYYIDLLNRANILLDKNYNIVVIEKVLGEDKNITVNCPLHNFNQKLDSIFLIKFIDERNKEYYEPLIKLNLNKDDKSMQFSFTKQDPHLSTLFKIIEDMCLKNVDTHPNLENVSNILKSRIKYHVINKNFKVIGFIIDNGLYIPIVPSGMKLNISVLKKYEIITYQQVLDRKLLLSYQEYKSKIKEFIELKGSLEEERKTYLNKKINGIITKNNLFIPLIGEDSYVGPGNHLDRELDIDNLIYNNPNEKKNNKTKKMNDYKEKETEYLEKKILINKTLLRKENKDTNLNIYRVIVNPVLEKKDKKKLIKSEILKLDLDVSNKLLDEILINEKNAIQFIQHRFRPKKEKKTSKNNINIRGDEFNNIRKELYGKKKYKYEKEINLFNTKILKKRAVDNKYKLNNVESIKESVIDNLSLDNKKVKLDPNIKVPKVTGKTIDMFGYDRKEEKNLKVGECKIPFKTRYNSYKDDRQTQTKQNTEYFYDCIPTSDGPICPTGDLKEGELFKRNLHEYAYCDYNDYFDRQEKNIKENKEFKFNEEECGEEPIFIRRKTKGGITDNVKITKKCLINQSRDKTAFNKKNPKETFKCLSKTKKGLKLYTEKEAKDCFINK